MPQAQPAPWRASVNRIIRRAEPGDVLSHAYDMFIVGVAFASIVPLMFRPQDVTAAQADALVVLDAVTVAILALDYLMRWATYDMKTGRAGWRAFARYPFTPMAVIDLLAILPSLGILPQSFMFLRVLRIMKVCRYSRSLMIIGNVFRAEKRTLLSVLAVALMYIFVSGLVMFTNEPDTFDNFFDALYWATTALTTVGYGDVYPTTDVGKAISMISSLFGIAIIALPAGIVTGGFLEQIRRTQERESRRALAGRDANARGERQSLEKTMAAFEEGREAASGLPESFDLAPMVAPVCESEVASDAPHSRFVVGVEVSERVRVEVRVLGGGVVTQGEMEALGILHDGSFAKFRDAVVPVFSECGIALSDVVAVGVAVPDDMAMQKSLRACHGLDCVDFELSAYDSLMRAIFPNATVEFSSEGEESGLSCNAVESAMFKALESCVVGAQRPDAR